MAQFLRAFGAEAPVDDARRLIGRFGSLKRFYSASRDALVAEPVCGPGLADALVSARLLAQAAARERLTGSPLDTTSDSFRNYLVARIGTRREERALILFFTGDGLYLGEDLLGSGLLAATMLPLRRIVRRAFELDARRVVVAHNHPSGNAMPSGQDIAATAKFKGVVQALEITLEDHCIVAGNQICSMKTLNLL